MGDRQARPPACCVLELFDEYGPVGTKARCFRITGQAVYLRGHPPEFRLECVALLSGRVASLQRELLLLREVVRCGLGKGGKERFEPGTRATQVFEVHFGASKLIECVAATRMVGRAVAEFLGTRGPAGRKQRLQPGADVRLARFHGREAALCRFERFLGLFAARPSIAGVVEPFDQAEGRPLDFPNVGQPV